MKKILIIEDDNWISASLKLYLENSNFIVDLYHEWLNAVSVINKLKPDLVILDVNLPWKDWIEITKEIRISSALPIIMLTARTSELDRVNWLENWADDYIAKPFSPRELLARINTVVRRLSINTPPVDKNIISIQWVDINIVNKIVTVDWHKITLTSNEYDILKKLFQEKWAIISRDTIMKEIIWYDKYIYDRTVDTHIKNLRKKVWKPDFILTIRWEWYRLNI